MKQRITKEIKQTLQLLCQFRQLRNKCLRVIEQNDISVPELEQFKQLDTQFAIDLNLLPLQMITARRNRLTEAIDQIIDIESTLHLRVLKKNSQKQISPSESPNREVSSKGSQNETSPVQKISQRCQRKPTWDSRPRNDYIQNKQNQDGLEQEEIEAIKDELVFGQQELATVWLKNKPGVDQTSDDKIDRISKIVATLRKNVKLATDKQRREFGKVAPLEHPEYVKLLEQIEQQKQTINELQERNAKLAEENMRLRVSIKPSTPKQSLKFQTYDESREILFKNDDFQIAKIFGKPKSTRHGSLQKQRSAPEARIPDMLRYIFLLQEKIVDSLPLTDSSSNPQSNKIKFTIPQPQEVEMKPLIARPAIEIIPKLEEKSNLQPLVTQTNCLKEVGAKLSELRQQRKQIFDDDDIWNEIQNLKL